MGRRDLEDFIFTLASTGGWMKHGRPEGANLVDGACFVLLGGGHIPVQTSSVTRGNLLRWSYTVSILTRAPVGGELGAQDVAEERALEVVSFLLTSGRHFIVDSVSFIPSQNAGWFTSNISVSFHGVI